MNKGAPYDTNYANCYEQKQKKVKHMTAFPYNYKEQPGVKI